jgi:hypothetical protein
MKTRAAKFVAAILASILSSANGLAAPETAAPESAEQKADTCLTSPREYAPPGTRWRYRVERGTGRHCWFLKDGAERAAGKAAEQSAAAEEPAPAPPRKKPAETRSISDARAEFSRAPVEQARPAPQGAPAPAAGAPVIDNGDPASARNANNMLAPATATRWPDPMSSGNPLANQPAPAPAAADQSAEMRVAPAAIPPAKPPVMPRVVPPAPVTDKPMSLPMLITVTAGGLSVLGVLASLLFAWLSSRRTRLTPSAPMPPLEVPDADTPRRPGDLYRERKRMRAQRNGRRAA